MLFQEVPVGRPFIFGGDHWTKRTGIYAKCTRTGQDHLFLQMTEVEDAQQPSQGCPMNPRNVETMLIRLILMATLLYCYWHWYGIGHYIDVCLCKESFWAGWAMEPRNVRYSGSNMLLGYLARIIFEAARGIFGLVAFLWLIGRNHNDNFSLAGLLRQRN